MLNLETPKKFRPLIGNAHQVAMNMLRRLSESSSDAGFSSP